jgi:hypothetical protein
VRVLTSGGPSGFAKPQSRKDNDAIPHQSGDRAADPFIPASFARFDRAMVRTLRQTRIHQPLFKADLESQSSRRLRRERQRIIELVLADWPPDARLQDDSRLPQGQRRGHIPGAPSSRRLHRQNDHSDHDYRRYLIDNTLEPAAPIAIGGEILNARDRLRGTSCG